MGVRFSLKWLLAAMIYAALAAAAFTHTHWAYADLLWLVALFSVVYAATLTVFARGRQQGGAIGFVIASTLAMWALYSDDSSSLPTERLVSSLASFGDAPSDGSQIPNPFSPYSPPISAPPIALDSMIDSDVVSPPRSGTLVPPSAIPAYGGPAIIDFQRQMRQVRAANAVAGLISAALGLAAHRRANPTNSEDGAGRP